MKLTITIADQDMDTAKEYVEAWADHAAAQAKYLNRQRDEFVQPLLADMRAKYDALQEAERRLGSLLARSAREAINAEIAAK